jgi:O-antigen ligase
MSKKKKVAAPSYRSAGSAPSTVFDHSYLFFYLFIGFTAVFLPYYQAKDTMDLSLMPRAFVLSIALLGFALFQIIPNKYVNKNLDGLKQPIFLVLIAYGLISLISWSQSRVPQEGYFDLVKTSLFIGVILFAVIAFTNYKDWPEKLPLLVAITAVIALVAGLDQYIEHVLNNSAKVLSDGRATIYKVEGRMSHKNEYANALMLLLPFLAYGTYRLKSIQKVICGLVLLGVLSMILILKTRAVWVGVLGAVYMMSLLGMLFYKKLEISRRTRMVILSLLAVIAVGLVAIFSMDRPTNDFSFTGRIYSLLDMQSNHNVHRLRIWSATWQMFLERPWIGWGPGNWNLEYMSYIAGMFDEIEQTNWERPHNDFLWVLAEKGIFGFAAFISFFGLLFYMVIKILQRSNDRNDSILTIFLFGGVIAYLAISFFSFPLERINHQVFLGLICAGILSIHFKYAPKSSWAFKSWYLAPAVAIFGFGVFYGHKAVVQEQYIKKANVAFAKNDFQECIRQADLSRNPYRLITNGMRPADDYIALSYERLNEPAKALEAVDKALQIYPKNIIMHNRKGLYLFLLERYDEALEYALSAVEILPRSKKTLYDLTACYIKVDELEKAYETVMKIPKPKKYPDVINAQTQLSLALGLPDPHATESSSSQ